MKLFTKISSLAFSVMFLSSAVSAGPVFLTGHDTDFHAAANQTSAKSMLNVVLNFVTGGTYSGGTQKFLFVESDITPPNGFLTGENGLVNIGLTAGTHYDAVNAAQLAALSGFGDYSAIVVASSFGGMLTHAEITGLNTRSAEIASFVNAGGGLAAFAECFPTSSFCLSANVNSGTDLFGFVPVDVTSVATAVPYSVTSFGASLGLTNEMVNDCCTHNSFGATGGLNVADVDASGTPTTLAGIVRITDDRFVPENVPEPVTLSLLGSGLVGIGLLRRRRA